MGWVGWVGKGGGRALRCGPGLLLCHACSCRWQLLSDDIDKVLLLDSRGGRVGVLGMVTP